MPRLSRPDWLALLLSLLAVLASAWVSFNIYEAVPHIEDEFAYTWQAAVVASGRLKVPTPTESKSFLIPFVVDYQGWRFSKYPIGWSGILAMGVRLGMRGWVNPLLAGLSVWLTYLLGKAIASEKIGLLASGLTLVSPFFLINSGSLLAHPLGLALSAAFALGWIKAFTRPLSGKPGWAASGAGLALGLLAVTRPYTALAVALPFGLHSLWLLWKGERADRLRLLGFGAIALAVSLIHLAWQYAATGDPFLNTYTLWWEYDKIGFGAGIGASEGGHTLDKAINSTRHSLATGASDTFGWLRLSYIFIPFGIWALRKNLRAWLAGSVFPVLVLAYMAYWVGAYLFGPRYYYEGLYSLTLLSAAGIAWLGGWAVEGVRNPNTAGGIGRLRRLGVFTLLAVLVGGNLFFYLPARLESMYRLFSIGGRELDTFRQTASQAVTPALVFVDTERWMYYAIYTDLENPNLSSPFIFAWSIGPHTDQAATEDFPERSVYYYYPDEPGRFYRTPRPSGQPE